MRRMHVLRHRKRVRAGFTIIEMVVVMMILAVATAITIPALLPPPADDDLTAAARQIDLLFGSARDSAARSGSAVTVLIDSATGGVWLIADGGAEGAATSVSGVSDVTAAAPAASAATSGLQRFPTDRAGAVGEPLDLPASVRIQLSKSRAQFRFAPTGAAFADSLVLRTPGGSRLVTIDPWNGHAILH